MQKGTTTRVEIFQYPASGNPPPIRWNDLSEISAASDSTTTGGFHDESTDSDTAKTKPSPASEEMERSFEAGREQGIREARDEAATEQQALLQQAEKARMDQVANLAGKFATERDGLLQTMESEVVRLALAIAARILRREAQMDPLFLLGAVRVALGQLAETMHVNLRVPASEAELWIKTLAHLPNLRTAPSVVPDDRMQLGNCFIETEMGSVDLGLSAQLHVAERTLFHGSNAKTSGNQTNCHRYENEGRV